MDVWYIVITKTKIMMGLSFSIVKFKLSAGAKKIR